MKSRTIWMCASCYACTTRCPAGIKITDVVYALKRAATEKHQKPDAPQVVLLAQLFVENITKYGRLHEGTLIRKYYAHTGITRLLGFIPLARKLFATKRLAPFPKKIRDRDAFSRILRKAQEIGMRESPNGSHP
jgi:heterodisulfide reductase subunit C